MNASSESPAKLVRARIRESIAVKRSLLKQAAKIAEIAGVITRAYREGGKVILMGNGGSAADAQHIAAELLGRFYRTRDSLPAISLSTNSSSLTAISNDFSFADVFEIQLKAYGNEGDVVIGLSTSGNSPNVVNALRAARKMGLTTVGFTGAGGRMVELSDYCVTIPSHDSARIQESHITAAHIICELVERSLFPDK